MPLPWNDINSLLFHGKQDDSISEMDPRNASQFEEFCGGQFWDLDTTWYTNEPDFTPCFHRTIIAWVPCAVLLLLAPISFFKNL